MGTVQPFIGKIRQGIMNEEWAELAEDYIHNRLSDQARTAFESRLQEDGEFRAVVKPLLLAEIALKVKNNQERQARFDGWYEEAAAERPTPRMRPIYFVLSGVAAALIILFLFVLPDKQPTTTGTPEEWFTEAYEPYLPPEVRSTVLTTDSLRQKAYVLILEGEHAAAIPLLQTLIRQETASEGQIQNDRLYLASCFLSEGKAAAALEILQASPPITGDDAIWYEALALLKLARLTEAQPLFQDLASREVPFYGPKSQQLLEKIDQRL